MFHGWLRSRLRAFSPPASRCWLLHTDSARGFGRFCLGDNGIAVGGLRPDCGRWFIIASCSGVRLLRALPLFRPLRLLQRLRLLLLRFFLRRLHQLGFAR